LKNPVVIELKSEKAKKKILEKTKSKFLKTENSYLLKMQEKIFCNYSAPHPKNLIDLT